MADTELVVGLGVFFLGLLGSIWGCVVRGNRAAVARATAIDRRNRDPLRETLVSAPAPEAATRAQTSFRHAAEGANVCGFCGFENLRRFRFCRLCTCTLPKPPSSEATTTSDYEQLEVREACRPLRTLNVAQRQVRAKLRGEWRRRLDVAGDLFWFRDDIGGFNSSATRFPGYALRFSGSGSEFHGSSKVVIETTRSRQEVVDALNLEVAMAEVTLTESSRANPAQLPVDDGHLGGLHWGPVLELAAQGFLNKYACFAAAAAALTVPPEEQLVRLTISHASLLEDSMEALAALSRGSVRSSIHVSFVGDTSASQTSKRAKRYNEWFMYVNHQLAEPVFGVFRVVTNTEQTFYLNANSLHDIGEHHLMYYFATGRLVGRALLEGQVLGFHLALPLLKLMLGIPVSFNDLEYVDPEGYKRLVNLLRVDDSDDILALKLHFCVVEQFASAADHDKGPEEQKSEGNHVVDLIPDGRNVQVTNLNKDEYLHRVFQHVLVECVSSQLYVFLKGLYEVIPQELLMLFDPEEFDYVLCNSDEINLTAWKKRKNQQRSNSSNRNGEGIDIDISAEVVVEGAGLLMELFDL